MKLLKIVIVVVLCLIVSLAVGLFNSHNYIQSAENMAVLIASDLIDKKNENICYVGDIDTTFDGIDLLVETDKGVYHIRMIVTNYLINFTFLNLLLSPTVEVRVMEKWELEESKCIGR